MKILLADDHALFREGMRHVLAQLAEDVAVVEAGDCDEALGQAAAHDDLGLVLLDLHMPGQGGIAALETMARRYPTLHRSTGRRTRRASSHQRQVMPRRTELRPSA